MPSEEVKYEECEKMFLDSEEGPIIGKATMPWVSDWPVHFGLLVVTALAGFRVLVQVDEGLERSAVLNWEKKVVQAKEAAAAG